MLVFHDEPLRTQYAEVKDRALGAGTLLPGSPGSLVTHKRPDGVVTLCRAWSDGNRRRESYLGADEPEVRAAAQQQIDFAQWMQQRVTALRGLGFQVADKPTARVLVELHNNGLFEAGLVLVGTLAFMAHLNDRGVRHITSRTLDIDVARPLALKLAARKPLQRLLKNTEMGFVPVPALARNGPSTSLKLPGAEGLRVDLLASSSRLGAPVAIPELDWHAQGIPFYAYLLQHHEPSVVLAGWQAVPVRLPSAGRFVWHKFYSSQARKGRSDKARKDYQQAVLLAAAVIRDTPRELGTAWDEAPASLQRALKSHRARFMRDLTAVAPEAAEL
jgi:hypothetical protein